MADNVERLRSEGLLHDDVTKLDKKATKAINDLTPDEMSELIRIHNKVGPVKTTGGPVDRMLIF